MPYIPAVNVCQAELVYNWSSSVVENVLHFKPSTLLDVTLMAELGAHLVTWYTTVMDLKHPTNISLINVKLTDLTSQTHPVLNYATGLPLPGLNASPSLPNNCALVITKRTLQRGRSFRGRIYHPGLKESEVTDNTVLAAQVTDYVNYYEQLAEFSTTGAGWKMVVISRYADNAPRVTAEITEVIGLDSDGVVDSQRRRLPGRGA